MSLSIRGRQVLLAQWFSGILMGPLALGGSEVWMEKLEHPIWISDSMVGESHFFIRESEDEPPKARLLFSPTGPIRIVHPASGREFETGNDFKVDPAAKTVSLTEESPIPFQTREQMYPAPGAPNTIPGKRDSDRHLLFGEGHYFHDLQVECSYSHSGEEWNEWGAYVPHSAADRSPNTVEILESGKPLKVVLLGDSISEGYNASGFVGAEPYQPAYGGLVAAGLKKRYPSEIQFKNLAKAGMDTVWGIGQMDAVLAEKPDLAILAFGMNDSNSKSPEEYRANTEKMIQSLREANPKTEIILVATMIGNQEWNAVPEVETFLAYRDELSKLVGEGIALADLTAVWAELLKHKGFHDLTGNGVNHPNDFGHRLYAQVILALLDRPQSAALASRALSNRQTHAKLGIKGTRSIQPPCCEIRLPCLPRILCFPRFKPITPRPSSP